VLRLRFTSPAARRIADIAIDTLKARGILRGWLSETKSPAKSRADFEV
jgi:hypothetical protein